MRRTCCSSAGSTRHSFNGQNSVWAVVTLPHCWNPRREKAGAPSVTLQSAAHMLPRARDARDLASRRRIRGCCRCGLAATTMFPSAAEPIPTHRPAASRHPSFERTPGRLYVDGVVQMTYSEIVVDKPERGRAGSLTREKE